jgi:hypothetical protein
VAGLKRGLRLGKLERQPVGMDLSDSVSDDTSRDQEQPRGNDDQCEIALHGI